MRRWRTTRRAGADDEAGAGTDGDVDECVHGLLVLGWAVSSPKKLTFKDKLVGKGVSTDLTIKKLHALHRELADLEQGLVDVTSLEVSAKNL
jgi:hypothetical protein